MSTMKKLAFRIIVIAILFASPSFSEPYKGFRPTFNINPFLVFGDDISLGGEINVTFINEQRYYISAGSIIRRFIDSDSDKPLLYASPNISISYMINEMTYIGISIGPEFGVSDIGVSSRAWLDLFGLEVSWTKKRGMGGGIYLYVPLAPVMFIFAIL